MASLTLAACGGGQEGGPATVTVTAPAEQAASTTDGGGDAANEDQGVEDAADTTPVQLDPAASRAVQGSLISCLNAAGVKAESGTDDPPSVQVTETSDNLALITIVSTDYRAEDLVDVVRADLEVYFEEPNGVYLEFWTTRAPGVEVAGELDRCYQEAGLPPLDRGDFGLEGLDEAPSSSDSADDSADVVYRRVGQTAGDDGVLFRVDGVEEADSFYVGDYTDTIVPGPGAKLYIATITYKNNRDLAIDPFCGGGSAVLLDGRDRNYDWDNDSIYLESNNICQDGTQPGFKDTVKIAFRVPASRQVAAIAVWNGDSDGEDVSGDASYIVFELRS